MLICGGQKYLNMWLRNIWMGPLDIGVQIWQGCKTQLQDKPTDETVQILRTFCDAYQGEILQKCKLSDLLVLNNYEEQINVKI